MSAGSDAAVNEIAAILRRLIKPEAVLEVMTTPAPAYGGKSMLQVIGEGKPILVLDVLQSLEWGTRT